MRPDLILWTQTKCIFWQKLSGFRTRMGKDWDFEDNFNKKTVLSLPVPHYQNQLGNLWKSLNKKNIYIYNQKNINFFVASLLTRATVFFQQRILCLIRKLINAKRSFIIMEGKNKTFFYLIFTGSSCHDIFYHWIVSTERKNHFPVCLKNFVFLLSFGRRTI